MLCVSRRCLFFSAVKVLQNNKTKNKFQTETILTHIERKHFFKLFNSRPLQESFHGIIPAYDYLRDVTDLETEPSFVC